MKRKIALAIIVLSLVISWTVTASGAVANVCFTAINDMLEPLHDNTMPIVIGSQLYIPCEFFISDELGVYYVPGDTKVMLYNATKKIVFETNKDIIIGQGENQQFIPAAKKNGRLYVPVDAVCAYFELTYDIITSTIAPVVRFYNSLVKFSNDAFIAVNLSKMQVEYNKYTGVTIPAGPSSSPEAPETPTYEDISVYLSFYGLSGGGLGSVLETLVATNYKACIFVTADEIAANAGLLRRAAGRGDMIGIRLTEGTKEGAYQEYREASALLFEAALAKTVIVTALGEAAAAAGDMAKEKSLVFWRPTKNFDAETKLTVAGLTGKLSTVKGTRESLYFTCSEGVSGVLRPFLAYLSRYEYSVRRITETSIPVMTA